MTWEPTTRGTSPTKNICHYGLCREINTRLDFYIVDRFGVRYFCDNHWPWIGLFTQMVGECKKCARNYQAELYKDARGMDSFKHQDKWWELCERHASVFEKEMCTYF